VYWSFAPSFGVVPTKYILDTDVSWEAWLAEPAVAGKEGSCLRGARFRQGALAPTQLNVEQTWGLLYDIDEWGDEPPLSPEEIAALAEDRCIVWSTYNHMQPGVNAAGEPTPPEPRYALFVPLERPLAPHQHRTVWERFNERLGGLAASGQHNLDRLRYLPRLPSEDARASYFWQVFGEETERLDPFEAWPDVEDMDDDLDFASYQSLGDDELVEPDRTGWIDDAAAKDKARVYFSGVGPGVQPGSRHYELFKVGCKLWWDFYLEHADVVELLHEVNQRFDQPKPLMEVYREVDETFARTRGHVRVAQNDPDGNVKAPGTMRHRPADLTWGELKQLAQIEKKSTDHSRRETGEILLRLIPKKDGHVEPIAKTDYRDKAARIAARHLGFKLPEHDPQTLANLFSDSLSMSEAQSPGAPTVEQVKAIIETAQQRARDVLERRAQQEAAAKADRIDRAFGGSGRRHEYTPEEVQQFADEAGSTLDRWRYRWVIVIGSSHYNFVGGNYKSPVGKDNFINAALVDLSPSADVSMYKINKQGDALALDRQEVIARYGTICRKGIVDLTAQRSFYDAEQDTFYEAPCPLRTDIVAERVPVIEQWLATFNDPRVVDFVANFTILDRPSAALYLHGQAKSGKTLFAHALARLYSRHSGPTDMAAYFESFNDDLLRCPLLFADERLPKQLLTKHGSDNFREMVQSQSRPLKRKFLSNMTLRGHYRLLLAANNDRMLPRGSGFMTDADNAAVSERLIYVPLDGKPADFLRALPQKERQAFIDDDLFAKHALWLRDRRQHTDDRFLVTGGASRVTGRMEYGGVRGEVLLFICTAITGESDIPQADPGVLPLFYDDHDQGIHVGINANIVRRHWEDVLGSGYKRPQVEDLSDAIRTLSIHGVESKRVRFGGKQRRYQVINSKHLVKWAEHNDFDPDLVIESLKEHAQKQGTTFPFDSRPSLRVINGGKQ
jgi:hypothetical protein